MPADPTLPTFAPQGMAGLMGFELRHALPVTWRALRSRMGVARTLGVVARYAVWGVTRNPLPDPKGASLRDRMANRQFRAAMVLELAAGTALPPAETRELVAEVIRDTGARFIATHVPLDVAATWGTTTQSDRERFAREAITRFFNADVTRLAASAGGLEFEVGACRFAEHAVATGRPHLAPMFCAADSEYFGRPGTPRLEREETLAGGHQRCAFFLRYLDEDAGQSPSGPLGDASTSSTKAIETPAPAAKSAP